MNQEEKLNLIQCTSKAQRISKLLLWSFIIVIGIFVSCSKDNEDIVADEYYVKYEVNSTTIYLGGKLDVTLNNENSKPFNISIDQRKLWETTVGPVNKGFNASIKVAASEETHDQLKLKTNIYVSKNNGPFALKKFDDSDIRRNSVDLNYTIDY